MIRNGLQLDWVDGFDPDRPTDDFRPRSSHAEVTDPELVKHVLDAVQQGCTERVERKDIKCCASMFAVDKASDEAHPEGGRRPITNLKNVDQFVQTTYFRLVTLWGILPFLRPGQYACKIDLKSAYFHMGSKGHQKSRKQRKQTGLKELAHICVLCSAIASPSLHSSSPIRVNPRHATHAEEASCTKAHVGIYSFGYRYAFHKVRSSGLPGLPVLRSLF